MATSNPLSAFSATDNDDDNDQKMNNDVRLLQPYIDAVTTTKDVIALRAIILRLLQDNDIYSGYDQIKLLLCCKESKENNGGTTTISSEMNLIHNTLDLFSYGTVSDYYNNNIQTDSNNNTNTNNKYLQLSHGQIHKLRQLTIISLVQTACREKNHTVPYATIQNAMQWDKSNNNDNIDNNSNVLLRDMEQLIAQILAANVMIGKLTQKKQALLVQSVLRSRDINIQNDLPVLLTSVQQLKLKVIQASTTLNTRQTQFNHAIEQEKFLLKSYNIDNKGSTDNNAQAMDVEGDNNNDTIISRRPKRGRGGMSTTLNIPDNNNNNNRGPFAL